MRLEYISVPGVKPIDPDAPVYRFFTLDAFKEMFQKRKLTLSSPEPWPDRFELGVLLSRTSVTIKGLPDCSFSLDPAPAWLQCWSRSSDSDVLMRAYSRVVNLATDKDCDHEHNTCKGEEGVRVRSTARKLMDASKDGSAGAEITGGEVVEVKACFIGAVGYVEQTFIESHLNEIASQIVKEGLGQADKDDDLKAIFARAQEVLGEPKTLARLLLLKRKAFEQESEVRVILIPRGRPDLRKGLPAGWRTDIARERAQQRCICIPFGPNKLFDEVTFDPRLRPLELKQRKERIKNLGYTRKFLDSPLYKPAHLRIEITLKPEVE